MIVVWTGYGERQGVDAIGRARALAPHARVLALTPDPVPHDDVARATRAGAVGFVDVGAAPDKIVEAIHAVRDGRDWFEPSETKAVLQAVAGDLDTTVQERRSRLIGIAVGLVPITGTIAALLSLLYRRYLGQIGVRPVDIAIDPASRVVDAISSIFFLFGFFGPLLFVGAGLQIARDSPVDRGPLAWLLRRRRTARIVLSTLLIVAATLLTVGFDLILILLVGPLVALALLATALDLSDELPRGLRLDRIRQRRAVWGDLVALGLFVAALSVESFVIGPKFDTTGVDGYLMPQVTTPARRMGLSASTDRRRAPRSVPRAASDVVVSRPCLRKGDGDTRAGQGPVRHLTAPQINETSGWRPQSGLRCRR